MNLEEKALNILSKHIVCDYCLGRQFSNLGTGTTNLYRGQTIKNFLAMQFSSIFSENNILNLQILSRSGSELAKNVLKKKEILPESTQKCYICEDFLKEVDNLAEIIIPQLKEYEFNSILVGTLLPKEFYTREEEIKNDFNTLQSEYLKQEFNRLIGKLLAKELQTTTDFQAPDIVIEVEPLSSNIHFKIKSLYIYGRYLKYLRTIPQTRWPCRKCHGKGCIECNNTGKKYSESVEELVEDEALKMTRGEKGTLHGAGREDIDALMLGTGRPFVLEIIAPRVRSINLKKLEVITNKSKTGKIEVKDYRWSSKKEVIHLKSSAKDTVKKYRALIVFESPISKNDIKLLEKKLKNKIIEQRTPIRVTHRRADKIRKKKVFSIDIKQKTADEFEAIITCDGGCYVKELISGDDGRTKPSVSEIVGFGVICKKLDVLEIEENPFIPESNNENRS